MSSLTPRRHFLTGLAGMAAAAAMPSVYAASARQTVLVMTNHNDDTLSLFEEAFEKAQTQYRVKVTWAMPPDAMKYLRRQEPQSPDVWWQAAPHNHLADMSKEGYLQALALNRDGLPATIGKLPLVADDDSYCATQLTAFGFLVNRKAIEEQKLPWPTDWNVLAQPAYAGKLALGDASQLRFNTNMLEIVLQSYGWDAGWALLSAIAGNAQLFAKGVPEAVLGGRLPVGLQIDIVPNAEQRQPQPMERAYPLHGGIINAGYIGILKRSANAEGARAFVNFVLSAQGQRLLPATELPRLPIRPATYALLGQAQFNPFAAQAAGQFTYALGDEGNRAAAIGPLFAALVKEQAELARLWARLHAAQQRGSSASQLAGARQALEAVPISAEQAASAELRQAFRVNRSAPPLAGASAPSARPRPTASAPTVANSTSEVPPVAEQNTESRPERSAAAKATIQSWEEFFHIRRVTAAKLLDEVGA
jgi:ABC-type Fe3+ transport system substrate-binding protein